MSEKGKELVKKLLDLKSEGKVAFETIEGVMGADIEDLIYKQPAEGLLYDLNRDSATCLTWIEQEKDGWLNNYAAGQVILKLHADVLAARSRIDELEKK